MLKQVHFAGIKSLLDVTVDLEPFTVIVGPNGCGKSTLLDQIELVVRAAALDPGRAHSLGALGRLLQPDGPQELRTAGSGAACAWDAVFSDGRTIRVLSEERPPKPWYETTAVTLGAGERVAVLSTSTDAPGREAFGAMVRSFDARAQRLALVPGNIAVPCPVQLEGLDPTGYRLATVLMYMSTRHREAYAALHEDLAKVVPQFRGIWIDNERRGVKGDGEVFSLDLVMAQGRVPAHQVSDGTLIALALLTAVHNPDLPKLVLMDDLDHGLHLGAQYQMITAIRRVMQLRPELQVICTTHSPVLLDCVETSEVRVMALDAQGYTHVKPLSAHPETEEWRRSLTAGELWANLGEEWVLDA